MNCYVCGNTDFYRTGKKSDEREIIICKPCGSVMYEIEPSAEQKIKDYYRHEYRPAPSVLNLTTCSHKEKYIEAFLGDWLNSKTGKVKMVCGDVGSAIGYLPNMMRSRGHEAYGSELTVTYRRFSEHFYGVPLFEELPADKRYDFISIYHVLEHLIEPDKKLAHYVSLLKDDGMMLVATPQWFETLEESSGAPITTFDHWFHKDHINIFSEQSLKNLFDKVGLEIVKENHITYGQTYLLKKRTGERKGNVVESWELRRDQLDLMFEAIGKYLEGIKTTQAMKDGSPMFLDALAKWRKFPDCWLQLIFGAHLKDPEKQEELFQQAFAEMPDNVRMKLAYGVWKYQRQEWQEAVNCLDYVAANRPNEDVLIYIGWCWEHLGDRKKAMGAFGNAAAINPQKWNEAYGAICRCAGLLPAWDEVAQAKLTEKLLKEHVSGNGDNPKGPIPLKVV